MIVIEKHTALAPRPDGYGEEGSTNSFRMGFPARGQTKEGTDMMDAETKLGAPSSQPPRPDFIAANAAKALAEDARGLAASLVAHNPFYLVSACFFLYALKVMFGTDDIWIDTMVPLALIASYSILTAGTAVFISRRGAVWDDARSLGPDHSFF